MFELIAYIFKIIISLSIGYIIGYNYKKEKDLISVQFHTTLITFFVTSISGVIILYPDYSIGSMSLILLGIIYYISNNFKDLEDMNRNKLLFSMINGFIIGIGYVFYSIIITILFSYLVNNYDIIAQLFNKEYLDLKENNPEEKNEIDINE